MINLVIEFLGLLRRLARRFSRKKKTRSKKVEKIICTSCGRRFDVDHIKASYKCAYCCCESSESKENSM